MSPNLIRILWEIGCVGPSVVTPLRMRAAHFSRDCACAAAGATYGELFLAGFGLLGLIPLSLKMSLGEVHHLHSVGVYSDGPGHGRRCPVLAAARQVTSLPEVRSLPGVVFLLHQVVTRPEGH